MTTPTQTPPNTPKIAPQTTFELNASQLRRCTNPTTLPKNTTLAPAFDPTFGQARAFKAINTALDIKANGYHIFAVGENGLGKRTLISKMLAKRAKHEPTPNDLVYVHNFANPRTPIALSLPPKVGTDFAKDMEKLWQSCHKKLLQKFTSLSYQTQFSAIKQELQSEENRLLSKFNDSAKTHNLSLAIHPAGVDFGDEKRNVFSVIDPSKPINESALPTLQKKLVALNHALDELEDASNERIDTLHDTLANKALEPLFRTLFKRYKDPQLHTYLQACYDDMVLNAIAIVESSDEFAPTGFNNSPARYSVNVLISHDPKAGAPIVFEDLPTHLNLLGHIEYVTHLGTVYCDVSMIRAGALHKANGGYLILEAQNLLEHPYAWQGLKRALQSKQIKISSLEQMLTLTGSLSLEPMSVELSVKVILLGEPQLYYELLEFEPEFNAVFKIRADFHDTVIRNATSETALVAKMADIIKEHHLLYFDNTACAEVINELACLADDNTKLDLHTDRLSGLLLESHRHALQSASSHVTHRHVKAALADMNERKNYLKELYWQEIQNGQQLISTQGVAIGQINALTVISYADSEFGLPARLTALIQPNFGNGEILDIERDVELGGSLHAKGMLIMAGYLRALFSAYTPLNFSASLAFEQSYGHIDGDSATLAEACVLLSALADVPIAQHIAITGSMNQLGQAQAVGGINAKVAGFFDACTEQGLTGNQGVIIPRTNLAQLMLRDDIVQAVAEGRFHLYAVCHINDALALLTGMAVADKNKKGEFKKSTLFAKVLERLNQWNDDKEKDDNKEKEDDKAKKK